MKHIEVVTHRNKLEKVKGLNGFEAKILVRKNLAAIEKVLTPLSEVEEENVAILKEFQKENNKLKEKYSGKTDETSKAEHEKLYQELKEKYKEEIEKYDNASEEYAKVLKEMESEFVPIMIPFSLIKKYESDIFDESTSALIRKGISEENLEAIWPFIDHEK